MICKICASKGVKEIYDGKIRDGGLGQYTKENIPVFQCGDCGVIWHDPILVNTRYYYETEIYRNSLEGSSDEETFYQLHDKEILEKLQYTGTTIFRNKIVADVGCGCGAFLDFVQGSAQSVIAVEPSQKYRTIMEQKGFHVFPYVKEAFPDWKGRVDVVTSFDVIEHVEDPEAFMKEIHILLKEGGQAIIGTPTDAPVMRQLLGRIYEKKLLFSTQHLWIFSEKSLKLLSKKAGFEDINIKYSQRYGIDNMIGWVKEKEPNSEINLSVFTKTLNHVWKNQLSEQAMGDYLVLYLQK